MTDDCRLPELAWAKLDGCDCRLLDLAWVRLDGSDCRLPELAWVRVALGLTGRNSPQSLLFRRLERERMAGEE